MTEVSDCARCKIPANEKICFNHGGRGPSFCPTLSFAKLVPEVLAEYRRPELEPMARMASIQEAECYANRAPGPYLLQPSKCRIQETIELAAKLGFKRLGLAFCAGLQSEAAMVADIFEAQGFEVVSVACKAGGVPKEAIGLRDDQKVRMGTPETMCNPLMQAEILNRSAVGLNVLLGLCVGHDALFLKKADALCTVLAVKDRVTGHNPLAALYTSHSYYYRLKRM